MQGKRNRLVTIHEVLNAKLNSHVEYKDLWSQYHLKVDVRRRTPTNQKTEALSTPSESTIVILNLLNVLIGVTQGISFCPNEMNSNQPDC